MRLVIKDNLWDCFSSLPDEWNDLPVDDSVEELLEKLDIEINIIRLPNYTTVQIKKQAVDLTEENAAKVVNLLISLFKINVEITLINGIFRIQVTEF